VLAPLLWHLLSGQPGALSALADHLFAGMTPPPRILRPEFIPPESPFVIVFNHYESPTAASWWGPLLISRAITAQRTRAPYEPRWLMAREWWYPPGLGRLVKQPLTYLLFVRLAQAYGFVLVPPVLSGGLTRGEGVAGVRHALALTRGPNPQLVGLAPEGHTGPGGALKEPPQGTGLFLLLLTHEAIPCLPVAWYENAARGLTIQFGEPFQLSVPRIKDRHARDRAAATQALTAIASLLPARLWGAYKEGIRKQVDK
jgi:1-acyl-sn-glycerol-3-phosphate acyltransferase